MSGPPTQEWSDSERKSGAPRAVFFSIVIPAHNEAAGIETTCTAILDAFRGRSVEDFEIVVVDDNSTDDSPAVLARLAERHPAIRHVRNPGPPGFGRAVQCGLEAFRGEAACIVMADLSDSPQDILRYYSEIQRGAECVFGSRFMPGGAVVDYPWPKLILNRLANWFIMTLFGIRYNDITNAFKCYRREVLVGAAPLLAKHFNLTVELPLKAIVRGFSYTVVPISWANRKTGISKLKIQEMGSRYLFIVLYIFLERLLSRGDYHRGSLEYADLSARLSGEE